MRKVFIIGIGAGNPDYVTVQAITALNEVDAFFFPAKVRRRRLFAPNRAMLAPMGDILKLIWWAVIGFPPCQ
jgi:hypothetical protein